MRHRVPSCAIASVRVDSSPFARLDARGGGELSECAGRKSVGGRPGAPEALSGRPQGPSGAPEAFRTAPRPFRRSGGLQDGPKALQALRRPSGRPKPGFPADPPENGAVESPPAHERHLPRGRGRGETPGVARRVGSPHVVRRRETFGGGALPGDSPGRPPNTRAGASRAASFPRPCFHRRTGGGFAPSGVSLQRPGLAGTGQRQGKGLLRKWSKPVDGCSIPGTGIPARSPATERRKS